MSSLDGASDALPANFLYSGALQEKGAVTSRWKKCKYISPTVTNITHTYGLGQQLIPNKIARGFFQEESV